MRTAWDKEETRVSRVIQTSQVHRHENVQSSLGTLLSELDRSMMSPDNGLAGRCVADREPRRHTIADLSRKKFSLHLMRCSVFPYALSCSSAIREASLLYTTVAVGPSPPAVVNTSGENVPCSTSLIRSSCIDPLLLQLLLPITSDSTGLGVCHAVALRKRVKNLYAKEWALPIPSPNLAQLSHEVSCQVPDLIVSD